MLERVLVAVVTKYVFGKLGLESVFVAVLVIVAKKIYLNMVEERVSVPEVAKYVCGKLLLKRLFVGVVARIVK